MISRHLPPAPAVSAANPSVISTLRAGCHFYLAPTPPIARRRRGRIAPLTRRLEILRRAGPRITAGGDCVARFVDGADMRPDDAVDALVQDLLGDPLARLAAIGGDAHERRHRRSQCPSLQDLPAVQHVLETVAQCADVVWAMLHLEHHAIV